jgi:NAD(P)-dependent dehydrogenase (short-subunit alcohol dehydrogenase family)
MPALQNKIAVITGGSSGIGLAAAKRFAAEGAQVIIVGRRQAELDKAVAEIGGKTTAVQADMANVEDIERLYRVIGETGLKIDIVFANAAFVEISPTSAATPAHFDKTFDTNARGVYFTVQKALLHRAEGVAVVE